MKNLKLNQTQALINRVCGQGVTMAIATAALATVALSTPQQALAARYDNNLRIQSDPNDLGSGIITNACGFAGEGGGIIVELAFETIPVENALRAINQMYRIAVPALEGKPDEMCVFSGPYYKDKQYGGYLETGDGMNTSALGVLMAVYNRDNDGLYTGNVLANFPRVRVGGNVAASGEVWVNQGVFTQASFQLAPNTSANLGGNKVYEVLAGRTVTAGAVGADAVNASQLSQISAFLKSVDTNNDFATFATMSSRLVEMYNAISGNVDPTETSSRLEAVSNQVNTLLSGGFTATVSNTLSSQIGALAAQLSSSLVNCDPCGFINNVWKPTLSNISSSVARVSAAVNSIPQLSGAIATLTNANASLSAAVSSAIAAGYGQGGNSAQVVALSNQLGLVSPGITNYQNKALAVSSVVKSWSDLVANISALSGSVSNMSTTVVNNVNILDSIQAGANYRVVVGSQGSSSSGSTTASATGSGSVALGYGAKATGQNSVAVGTNSVASTSNEFSVGDATTGLTRRVTNVSTPVASSDAANNSYLTTKVQEVVRALGGTTVGLTTEQRNGMAKTAARAGTLAGAMSGLPQLDVTRQIGLGVAIGSSGGASAIAVGASTRYQDVFVGKASYSNMLSSKSGSTGAERMFGLGGLVQW